MHVTLLGTGTSTGVPMIGCTCRTCLSTNPKDKRLRVSVLLETSTSNVLIDTSADFRQQMLTAKVKKLDAILYTHHHYDHIAGFDDLRAFQFLLKKSPTCYASEDAFNHIKRTFAYAFGGATQTGGGVPNVPFVFIDNKPFEAAGLHIQPIPLKHGVLSILGFRIGDFAYMTDCSSIPKESFALLEGIDTLILDGLRYRTHPTHFSVDEAVEAARRIAPRVTYLTHMNHDVMHDEAEAKLPDGVHLAYDGLNFTANENAHS